MITNEAAVENIRYRRNCPHKVMHEKNGEVRRIYALRSELRKHHLIYVGVKPVNIDNPQRRAERRLAKAGSSKAKTVSRRYVNHHWRQSLHRTQKDVISVMLIHGPKVGPLKCIDVLRCTNICATKMECRGLQNRRLLD